MTGERDGRLVESWGGGALAVGAALYAISILLYLLLYGQADASTASGEPSLADRVAHLEQHWVIARTVWSMEFAGLLTMAYAGLVLRDRSARSVHPDRLVWPVLTVGCVVTLLMYPLMLAGYPEAVRAFAREPAIMATLDSIATFIFETGNLVIFAGLAGAFAVSGQSHTIGRSVAVAGTVLASAGAVAATGMIFDVALLEALAPAGILSVLLAAYLGLAIVRFHRRHQ